MHWPDKEVQQRYKERAKIALKRAQEWREKEEQRKRETEALKHIYGLHGSHVMLWYARTYERSNGRSWGNLSEIMPGMVEARHKAGLPPWFSKKQLSGLYNQRQANWIQGAIVVALCIFFITQCTN